LIKSLLFRLWRVLPLPFFLRSGLIWLLTPKYLIGVDALIVNEENECLLFKHSYRKEYPWGLPSGYLHKREHPLEAIKREIFEESGYVVHITQLLDVYISKNMPSIALIFLGEIVDQMDFVPSAEVLEARFFPVDRLPKLLPDQQDIITMHLPHQG
jgi:ADP-ribose pyrophosphatase YjhB (NUDIX family)